METGEATRAFIRQHRKEDVRRLALAGTANKLVDLPFALQQIAGWQKARRKLPSWAANDAVCFPPSLAMEQCSSEATARYKADICRRIAKESHQSLLIDLTGGYGVDFSFMSEVFDQGIYIEQDGHLCEVVAHNLQVLGNNRATVMQGDSMALLPTLPSPTLLYADPARRDGNGRRTFAIADCTPDMTANRSLWLDKAPYTLIKLSPMLDWHKAVADINQGLPQPVVKEVHIVAAANECKELLLLVAPSEAPVTLTVVCVNDENSFRFSPTEGSPATAGFALPQPDMLLYEPNAAIMKAGCFAQVAACYGMMQVGTNSHLLLSQKRVDGFPGREFVVETVADMNKKTLQPLLQRITKANITVRNFPLTTAQLRQRLRIADGGDCYIFATTIGQRDHRLIVCRKGDTAATAAPR